VTEKKELNLPSEERTIGENRYRCSRLMLTQWIELEALLMKILGAQVLDLDENNLGAYATRAISSSTAQDHEKIFELMGYSVSVKNPQGGWGMLSRETQERWWAVYIRELPGVIGLFFEVQFKDFFTGLELLSKEEPS
jgi:hypothetical protein